MLNCESQDNLAAISLISGEFLFEQCDPVGEHEHRENKKVCRRYPVDGALAGALQSNHVEREVEENDEDLAAHYQRSRLDLVRTLHTSIDDKRHEGDNVGEQIKLNLVGQIACFQDVLDGHNISHDKG